VLIVANLADKAFMHHDDLSARWKQGTGVKALRNAFE
jgi:hypothetical protein